MAKKTLRGPGGIRVELDTREVFPDDPGAGTPALVCLRNATASYTCAADMGEVEEADGEVITLTDAQCRWLHEIGEQIDQFLGW